MWEDRRGWGGRLRLIWFRGGRMGGSKWKFNWAPAAVGVFGAAKLSAVEGGNREKDGWMDGGRGGVDRQWQAERIRGVEAQLNAKVTEFR